MIEKVIICMLRDTLHEDSQMIKDIPEIHKRVMNTSEKKVVIDFLLFCRPARKLLLTPKVNQILVFLLDILLVF